MVKPHWAGLDNYKVLLAISVGLLLAVYYIDDNSRSGLQRMVFVSSFVLAIWGAIVLQWLGDRIGKAFKYLVVSLLVIAYLAGSGLIPHVIGMNEHTGIFLSPDDILYQKRFITTEHAEALQTLDPNIHKVFFNSSYEHEASVSQGLIDPYKYRWVGYINDDCWDYYYIISSDRLIEHYQDARYYEILIIDIQGLKVWCCDLR